MMNTFIFLSHILVIFPMLFNITFEMMVPGKKAQFHSELMRSESYASSINSHYDSEGEYGTLMKMTDYWCPPVIARSVHRQLRLFEFWPVEVRQRDFELSMFDPSSAHGSADKLPGVFDENSNKRGKKLKSLMCALRLSRKAKAKQSVSKSYDCPSAIREQFQYAKSSGSFVATSQRLIMHVDSVQLFDKFAKENQQCLDMDGSLCFDMGLSVHNENGNYGYFDLFSREFPYLKELNVSLDLDLKNPRISTRSIVSGLAETLSKISNVTALSLDIINGGLGDEDVQILMEAVQTLTLMNSLHLNFQHNRLGQNAPRYVVQAIAAMPDLSSLKLNLANNQIQTKGAGFIAKVLKKCVRLKYLALDVSGNFIGDQGLVPIMFSIGGLKQLQELHLKTADNQIFVEAAEWISLAIGELKQLRLLSLDLYNNRIYDDGAMQIANAIHESDSLIAYSLHLGSNGVAAETRKYISNLLMKGSTSSMFDLDDIEVSYQDAEHENDNDEKKFIL